MKISRCFTHNLLFSGSPIIQEASREAHSLALNLQSRLDDISHSLAGVSQLQEKTKLVKNMVFVLE